MTISSRCSGRVACSSFSKPGSARATEIADTGTNLPTQVKLGNTTSSALGLAINTLADSEEASTNVCPTITPYSSVKVLEGSTKAQQFGQTPDTENGATISLSGGNTTEVVKNLSTCHRSPAPKRGTRLQRRVITRTTTSATVAHNYRLPTHNIKAHTYKQIQRPIVIHVFPTFLYL